MSSFFIKVGFATAAVKSAVDKSPTYIHSPTGLFLTRMDLHYLKWLTRGLSWYRLSCSSSVLDTRGNRIVDWFVGQGALPSNRHIN